MSINGEVIVGKVKEASNSNPQAFIWDEQKGLRFLGTFEGGDQSYAEAVSEDGKFVMGIGFNVNEQHKIFLWEEGKGIIKNLDVRWEESRYLSENGKRLICSCGKFRIYELGGELQTVAEIFGEKYSGFLKKTKILGGNKEGTVIVGEFHKTDQPFYALIPFPHILKTEGFKVSP